MDCPEMLIDSDACISRSTPRYGAAISSVRRRT
jgi:hypothetical protein